MKGQFAPRKTKVTWDVWMQNLFCTTGIRNVVLRPYFISIYCSNLSISLTSLQEKNEVDHF